MLFSGCANNADPSQQNKGDSFQVETTVPQESSISKKEKVPTSASSEEEIIAFFDSPHT